MALTHLVDTSVLTRMADVMVRDVVEPLAHLGGIARAGVTDLEIGFSARNEREWDRLLGALMPFQLIETSADDLRRARQVHRALAASGKRGRKVPDLLVAAAAERRGLRLLHYDRDFDLIAQVTGQHCEWVVAPGSVS